MLHVIDNQKQYTNLGYLYTFTKTPEIFIVKKFTCSRMSRKRDQRRNSQIVDILLTCGSKNSKGKGKALYFIGLLT